MLCFAARLVALVLLAGCVSSDPISGEGGGGGSNVVSDGGYVPQGGGYWEGGGTVDGPPVCGDDVCAIGETCDACAEDCPCEDPVCGDGLCDAAETCVICPADCGACGACDDGICDDAETCASCFEDCGECACSPDALEPNAGSGTASPLQLGVDHCDLSVCAADFDWLELQIVNGFSATIEFNHAEGDLDLEVYSGITSQYLAGSYSTDDIETVTLSGLQPGTYWARVYGYTETVENPAYCFRAD